MTITDTLDQLQEVAEKSGIDFEDFGLSDDEDIIIFALHFLQANLNDAFEGMAED